MNVQYEVLSPWAEVNPLPLSGISPRLTDLDDRTIGLYASHKVASSLIQAVVEAKLKERFHTLKFSWWKVALHDKLTLIEDRAKFEEWLKGVDAVVNAVGD